MYGKKERKKKNHKEGEKKYRKEFSLERVAFVSLYDLRCLREPLPSFPDSRPKRRNTFVSKEPRGQRERELDPGLRKISSVERRVRAGE